MRNDILSNLDNPAQLEKLYRTNKSAFKRSFDAVYPQLEGNTLASFWHARLHAVKEEISWGGKDLVFVIIASLLAGLMAKLPTIFNLNEEAFFMKNAGFLVFPFLSAYFVWKNKLSVNKIAFIAGTILLSLIFINFLPGDEKNDTFVLSCIHINLLLWSVLGVAFIGSGNNSTEKRLSYLSYNGDLVVMTALIMIAAGILSGVTVGLFSLIGFSIEKFYFQYVILFGLPAAPILATYLTQANPQLVGKVSPVIARIFSPLVLVMLVIYLGAIIYSGKDPYNDRDFLMMFNGLLVGVMAIIFFSVAESSRGTKNQWEILVLFLLSIVTIVVNGIALSAILFRISAWGITPNRAAVLGGNILILVNLVLVTAQLYRVIAKKASLSAVGNVISLYLPVYCLWAVIVTFLFPLLFGFK